MNAVAQGLATRALVVTLGVTGLVGAAQVGQVVTAERADAATWNNCRILDAGAGWSLGGTGYRFGLYCYVDYSWWEEVTNWNNKDGWKIVKYSHWRAVLASYL